MYLMKNKRLFAFGCSFTQNNRWPTWADIAGREYDFFNWGRAGAGNSFIFYSLMECIKRNNITSDDTVAVMWTSIGREDRYRRGQGWLTPGSIYNQTEYDYNFVERFADPTGYLIRDMAHVAGAKTILDAIGCRYHFLSAVPLSMPDDNVEDRFDIDGQITNLYQNEIDSIGPSIYSVVFNNNWYSRPGYINLEMLKKEYEDIAGSTWPTWNNFVQKNFNGVPAKILEEIQIARGFEKRLTIRSDLHPLPTEHLEYVRQCVPEFVVTAETENLVQQTTEQILSHQRITRWWTNHLNVKRF